MTSKTRVQGAAAGKGKHPCDMVLIADDHAVFREGLRLLMEARGFARVILEASDAASMRTAIISNPGLSLALIDIYMPGMENFALVKELHRERPALALVILTASEKLYDLKAAIAAGAKGFIPKTFHVGEILETLKRILAGEKYFPDHGSFSLDPIPAHLRAVSLSPRQQEILDLIARGYSNKHIARLLDTALPTVKNHVANIFEKLGVNNRVAAVNIARKAGLISDG